MVETIFFLVAPFLVAFVIRFLFIREQLSDRSALITSIILSAGYNLLLFFIIEIGLQPMDYLVNFAAESYLTYRILRM